MLLRTSRAAGLVAALLFGGCSIVNGYSDAPDASASASFDAAGPADAGNAAPSRPTVIIEPSAPKTGDELRAAVLTPSTDPEGATIEYRFTWWRDDLLQPDLDGVAVPASRTSRGDRWWVRVIASDGVVDSAPDTAEVEIGNTAPLLAGLLITPMDPGTAAELVATATATDDDGDPVTIRYTWSKDGLPQDGLTRPVVTSTCTARGDRWQVAAVAHDGLETGPHATAEVVILNTPPLLIAVTIDPPAPQTTDPLVATATAADVDGDPVTYRFQWARNGNVQAALTSAALPSDQTTRGEVWRASVTPSDGMNEGDGGDAEVTIVNAPPSVSSVVITPATPTGADDLIADAEGRDPDGDQVAFSYAWLRDGGPTGLGGPRLDSSATARGHRWSVVVMPTDTMMATGPSVTSSSVLVGNSPPTAPAVRIRPAPPTDRDVLECVIVGASTDGDGDAVAYAFSWTSSSTTTIVATSTLGPGFTTRGQAWTCAAVPHDGVAAGPAGEWTETIHAELVLIPPGSFTMGSPAAELGRNSDEVQRNITITRPFFIGARALSLADYTAVTGITPSFATICSGCPVSYVDWDDAIDFLNARSRQEGLAECYAGPRGARTFAGLDCPGYRLPTEAEWEYAARGGATTAFPTGDPMFIGCDLDTNLDQVGWYCGNACMGALCPVRASAQKAPNAWGLYDVLGNVAEWVNDWMAPYDLQDLTDPQGPSSGRLKVVRGGDVGRTVRECRLADRFQQQPDRLSIIGFRVARTQR